MRLLIGTAMIAVLMTIAWTTVEARIFNQSWQANITHCNATTHTVRLTETMIFAKTMYKELTTHCVRDVHAWRIK